MAVVAISFFHCRQSSVNIHTVTYMFITLEHTVFVMFIVVIVSKIRKVLYKLSIVTALFSLSTMFSFVMSIFRPVVERLVPLCFRNHDYHLILTEGKGSDKKGMNGSYICLFK